MAGATPEDPTAEADALDEALAKFQVPRPPTAMEAALELGLDDVAERLAATGAPEDAPTPEVLEAQREKLAETLEEYGVNVEEIPELVDEVHPRIEEHPPEARLGGWVKHEDVVAAPAVEGMTRGRRVDPLPPPRVARAADAGDVAWAKKLLELDDEAEARWGKYEDNPSLWSDGPAELRDEDEITAEVDVAVVAEALAVGVPGGVVAVGEPPVAVTVSDVVVDEGAEAIDVAVPDRGPLIIGAQVGAPRVMPPLELDVDQVKADAHVAKVMGPNTQADVEAGLFRVTVPVTFPDQLEPPPVDNAKVEDLAELTEIAHALRTEGFEDAAEHVERVVEAGDDIDAEVIATLAKSSRTHLEGVRARARELAKPKRTPVAVPTTPRKRIRLPPDKNSSPEAIGVGAVAFRMDHVPHSGHLVIGLVYFGEGNGTPPWDAYLCDLADETAKNVLGLDAERHEKNDDRRYRWYRLPPADTGWTRIGGDDDG